MPRLPDKHEDDRFIDPISYAQQPEDSEDLGDVDVLEQEDGSAIISPKDLGDAGETDFQENLAEVFPTGVVKSVATDLVELVGKDKEARKKRDEQYEEGLRRTGLGNDAPGGAAFDGASKTVHPMLAESCVDFESRAIKELFPPTGPVKSKIEGLETEAKIELADRKAKYLNWQLTVKMPEYRTELEQLLTQLPMGGSQYQKFWYDEQAKRQRTEFIPIDYIFLPFAATDFYTAQRVTHLQLITKIEFERRVKSGLYRDVVNLNSPPETPEGGATQEAANKIEGKESDAYNDDGLREVYETYVYLQFDDDERTGGELAPYIVTTDVHTEEVLAIYRNWEENDETFTKLDWIVEWKFIPWRGAYAIGFPHLIGGLSAAATGSLRALLDAAHINNSQALVKMKGGKMSGQNIVVEPTQITEIEGPAGTDDIRKVIMPMPYNPPSETLFKLLGWITSAGKSVIATAEDKMDQVGDRTPVGTTQALIEQGSHTYSSIHSRLHYSQAKALQVICRINRQFMDDQEQVEELGGLVISREDFSRSNDISPVSDPEIFSEAQRFAQMQGVMQVRSMYNGQTLPPLPFNDNAIARRMLRRMRIDNIDEILPEPPKPQNLNPIAENVASMHGQPILALPKQNHLAHLYAHLEFATNPVFMNPILGVKLSNIMIQHCQEHIAFYYADVMAKSSNFDNLVSQLSTTQLEDKLARLNTEVLAIVQQDMQPILQKLAQLAQFAQQVTPPPPMDPAVKATYDAAVQEINRKKERDKQELDIERQVKLQIQKDLDDKKIEVELMKNKQDNLQKAHTELLKNQGDNETKQWIESMKAGNTQQMAEFQAQIDWMAEMVKQNAQFGIAEADRQHQAAEADKDRKVQFASGILDKQHQATEGDKNRELQQTQADADRQHQAKEGDKNREVQASGGGDSSKPQKASQPKRPKVLDQGELLSQIAALIGNMNQPKEMEVVRGPDKKIIGVRHKAAKKEEDPGTQPKQE